MAAASFDDGSERGGAIAPHASGVHVPVDLSVDLAHGDAEFAGGWVTESLGKRKRIDEGWELQSVKFWHGGPRSVWGLRRLCHRVHGMHLLREAAARAVEEAEGSCLLEKAAARRVGRRQRAGLRSDEEWMRKARTPEVRSACFENRT